jgi:UDP-N-acetylglucosamine transferase subunit ALG13
MIFLTVGTDLPFNRLVRSMDAWAGQHDEQPVFAQVGRLGRNDYRPEHMEWVEMLPVHEFDMAYQLTDIIVAHAGMGSIIMALDLQKPIVLLPRKASLGEQRNEHQLATARKFGDRPGIIVAWDESELPSAITSACR